jgi:5,10-methylenetetrahydromethanopterin reductase
VALPPSRDVVEHARIAAGLGYERVWLFDSPALYGDIWIALARIAEAVPDINVATGVAVPSLRHPMVTASAIATIEDLAPGRLRVYFGTGHTARLAMGKTGMRWADLALYVRQVRQLLHGDVIEVDGAACQMMHSPGWAPPRPIEAHLGLAPIGPKGLAVSREVADGVILTGPPAEADQPWTSAALLVQGTVIDPGEDPAGERVAGALGPSYVAGIHALWSWAPELVDSAPGGPQWLAEIAAERPESERHLIVHEGHLVTVTDRDLPLLAALGDRIVDTGWTGDAESISARMEAVGQVGITEVVYSPAGPDLPRELKAFANAVR